MKRMGEDVRDVIKGSEQDKAERIFFDAIKSLVAGGSVVEIKAHSENKHMEQAARRVEKLGRVAKEVDKFRAEVFQQYEGKKDREEIIEALKLMLLVHIDHRDRSDTGLPAVSHPLKVARMVLEYARGMLHSVDVVVSALLHDTIEDEARMLHLERELGFSKRAGSESKDRSAGLRTIEDLFGPGAKNLIAGLSGPIRTGNPSEEEKHKAYFAYIKEIFEDTDNPARAVIKWADLQDNALTVGLIKERAEVAKNSEDPAIVKDAPVISEFYHSRVKKYKRVLEKIVLPFFEKISENHPLFAQKDTAISRIKEVLKTYYSLTA
ncbi:MAG: hypothetical protein Q8P16_01715 [bacterium]|nr:hypothetical protein [bacterium]